ncbi:MAG: VWA domain-containing protein [Mariprofundaceae bacterium]
MILDHFHFLRPLWLLLIPIWLLVSWWFWTRQKKQHGWSAICDPALLNYLLDGATSIQKKSSLWLLILFFLAGAAALVAMAGPVWQQLPQPVFRAQSGAIIILDLSRSMDAADVKPNRLIRAKQKVQDMVKLRREGQTGLIVFAGSAFDVVPLTHDHQAILSLLASLETSMMPTQGSHASLALDRALAMFKRGAVQQGAVLMFTDGVDAESIGSAKALADAGHQLSVLAVGTATGAPIPTQDGFVKDKNGSIIIPAVDHASLMAVANAGHGIYRPIRIDDLDLKNLPGLEVGEHAVMLQEDLQTDQWREEGGWLILLLVIPLLSLLFRKGLLVLLILPLCTFPYQHAHASAWRDLWQRSDQQGQALMRNEQYEAASKVFSDPAWRAAAEYRSGKYKDAAQTMAKVNSSEGWYNQGNALAKAGDLQAAIEAYDQALAGDEHHQDATFNRNLVEKVLQQSEEKSKEQSENHDDSDQEKNKGEQDSSQGDPSNQHDESDKQQSGDSSASDAQSDPMNTEEEKESKPESGTESAEEQRDQQEAGEKGSQMTGEEENAMKKDELLDAQELEEAAAQKQWLRRIPDDPGGLLRRKFLYQYQQQQPMRQEHNAW